MRSFALQSVVQGQSALTALREVWGLPCTPGEVTLEESGDTVTGRVSQGGQTLAELTLAGREEIEPDLARLDPVLSLRLAPSVQRDVRHDLIQLVQIDPEMEITAASRGKGEVRYPATEGWDILPCRNVVSAVYCTLDTELPLARFVMPY
jgi:hypothetical protein